MKFLSFKYDNEIKIGYLKDNEVFELKGEILDYFNKKIKEEDRINSYLLDEVKIESPVTPTKIICIGLNYKDHAKEMNLEIPEQPIIFIKPSSTIIGHEENIIYPENSKRVDYEGELAIVIGKTCRNVKINEANDYIFGYTIMNDVTARDFTYSDGQWTRGKSCDTFAPLGPYIETNLNPLKQEIKLKINKKIKQESNTENMIFSPEYLIEYISKNMTLNPGDIISTGTPPGVEPMEKGDIVEITIEDIGTLKNKLI